jgi:hypothetical protein
MQHWSPFEQSSDPAHDQARTWHCEAGLQPFSADPWQHTVAGYVQIPASILVRPPRMSHCKVTFRAPSELASALPPGGLEVFEQCTIAAIVMIAKDDGQRFLARTMRVPFLRTVD